MNNLKNHIQTKRVSLLIMAIILTVIMYFVDGHLSGFWKTLLMLFGINIIFAVSLNITNSWINFFSIGHGGIILAGIYFAAFFTLPPSFKNGIVHLHLPEYVLNTQWTLFPALLAGSLFGALVAVLLAFPALRLKSFYFCAGSLGFAIIVTNIAENIRSITNGPAGLWQFPAYTNIWWVWGIAAVIVYVALTLKRSALGRAFIAIGRDQDLAEHMGINLLKYKIIAFALSGFIATCGGILWVHLIRTVSPGTFGLTFMFDIVAMMVIGGMGSISGAVIGAGVITFFLEVLAPIEEGFTLLGFQIPPFLGFTTILLGVLFIIVLIKKPEGIMGERELSFKAISRILKIND